jgi:hypothetical protein
VAETRTRSAERAASSLTSQFNFFFAELNSAIKRPDLLTVGVAGPFDPIDIPDDVKATHDALASKPDSASVKEIERCLQKKLVTDLSAKRKDDMLETITTVAMTAERDAPIKAKLAERSYVATRCHQRPTGRDT